MVYVRYRLYRILIIGGSGSRKVNVLLNLIKEQDNDELIDKIHLLIKIWMNQNINYRSKIVKMQEQNTYMIQKHLQSFQHIWMMFTVILLIEIQIQKRKVLVVFDDIIANIMINKKFRSIIKELFIRCTKLNMSLISCIYHTILFLCSKISYIEFYTPSNNEDSQQKRATEIAINHSADINYKDFMKINRKCTSESYSFSTIDTTLLATNSLRLRKIF